VIRTGSYADVWRFTLGVGQSIQIDMTSSFDNYLILYRGSTPSSSGFIMSNDDTNGLNARISTSLAAGTYCIEATSFGSGVTGAYTLSSNVLLTAGGGGGPYQYSGSLTTSDGRSVMRSGSYADVWRFTLSVGGSIQIDMTSSFDNYLILYRGSTPSSSGFIMSNDDTNGLNARISTSLATGTYCIEATSFGSGVTGSYTLTSTVQLSP
jgi:hypothetical protein